MVTSALVVANLLGFLYELSLGDGLDGFLHRWGLIPADVRASVEGGADSPAALVTLLTSMFLHTGWLHLISNLLYLAVFGPPVERQLGSARFAALYLASGLVGGIAHQLAQPMSTQPALGASGAVAGVIAAYLVLFPGATLGSVAPVLFFHKVENTPAVLLLLVWVATQLLSGVASLTASTSVAWWAHLGGFLTGFAIAVLVRPRRLRHKK
jgi:membrane associated rhomboid family serine protease